ncbi:hypothetical protein HYC85_021669 [Camellia sinensis]|uniref:Uncharacterized protein n=1 Tax=Camellia sinensis TaxID=4442 RepID=A0A7J7GIA0_CAMSI|nr:hypothetical protein HYC85_021669 [Camellia sinensis]
MIDMRDGEENVGRATLNAMAVDIINSCLASLMLNISKHSVNESKHEESKLQSKAISIGSRYGEKDMDNMAQRFRHEELPKTWYTQFFERYKATKPYRLSFGDRETDKRTPELMSTYLRILKKHKRRRAELALKLRAIAELRIIIKPKPCIGVGPLCAAQQVRLGLNLSLPDPYPMGTKLVIHTIIRSPTIISIPKSSDSVSSNSSRSKTRGRLTRKLLHKLVFQDDALPDGTELAYFVHGQQRFPSEAPCCDMYLFSDYLSSTEMHRREKDLDEVLQSQTVYSNVSKGVLAKSKDLVAAFGKDDQTNICLEFRDIATIVMQKTINPETQCPYTISMIQRLMHEIHFAVDPHSSSKKQSLDVIRELQKHLPIKLSPMRLRLYVPEQKFSSLSEKLNDWTASIVSKDESGSQLSIVPYITAALMDAKLGTEGRKDLFDWLSRQLSGLSNFPDVVYYGLNELLGTTGVLFSCFGDQFISLDK